MSSRADGERASSSFPAASSAGSCSCRPTFPCRSRQRRDGAQPARPLERARRRRQAGRRLPGTRPAAARARQAGGIKLGGVFNSLTLTVPEGTPVHVHGAGLPFNAVDRGVPGAPGARLRRQRRGHLHRRRRRTDRHARRRSRPVAPGRRRSRPAAAPAEPRRPKAGLSLTPPARGTRPRSCTNTLSTTIASTKCAAEDVPDVLGMAERRAGTRRSWCSITPLIAPPMPDREEVRAHVEARLLLGRDPGDVLLDPRRGDHLPHREQEDPEEDERRDGDPRA